MLLVALLSFRHYADFRYNTRVFALVRTTAQHFLGQRSRGRAAEPAFHLEAIAHVEAE
jgi:hypothetical protein